MKTEELFADTVLKFFENSEHHLPIGTRLSDFEIMGVLGEGSTAIVYLAYDHSIQRKVAIKEYMPASMVGRSADGSVTIRAERHRVAFEAGLKSFINEARLLAQFDHPSLAKVYRCWEQNRTYYMVLRFYDGQTLKDIVENRPDIVTEAWLKFIFKQILEALDTLYKAKVLHCDVSPDNIIVQKNGDAVLLDFGSARQMIGDMTQGLTAILKPGYAPVEQYSDEDSMVQGPWTDIYALAAVMYFAIVKSPPVSAVARMIKDSLVPLQDGLHVGFSYKFLVAIDKGLAVMPEDRPQSMEEFRLLLGIPAFQSARRGRASIAEEKSHPGKDDIKTPSRTRRGDDSSIPAKQAISKFWPPSIGEQVQKVRAFLTGKRNPPNVVESEKIPLPKQPGRGKIERTASSPVDQKTKDLPPQPPPRKKCPRATTDIASCHTIAKEQLARNNHNVVLVCGAGVTMSKYPEDGSWAAFLRTGIQYAQNSGISPETILQMQAVLDNPAATTIDWLRVGHELTTSLKEKDRLHLWLRDKVEFKFTDSNSELLNAIALCAQVSRVRLATTNYDFLLERAIGWEHGIPNLPGFTWRDKSKQGDWQRGELREVFHLHGHAREPESIVLGHASYADLNSNPWVKQLREAMSMTDSVIFIGCGATLEDPAFQAIFDGPLKTAQHANHNRMWFQLVSNDECVGNPNLVALPYGANRDALPGFLQNQLLAWLGDSPSDTPTTTPNPSSGSAAPPLPSNVEPAVVTITLPQIAIEAARTDLTALERLETLFSAALEEATANSFKQKLCHQLKLPMNTSPKNILLGLDNLPSLKEQLFCIHRAIKDEQLTPGSTIHAVERAGSAVYMRAAIRAVTTEAIQAIRTSTPGLTVVPEKSEVVIAILMGAVEKEVHELVLRAEHDQTGRTGNMYARAEAMIDLDEFPHDPLLDDLALEMETLKRVDKSWNPLQSLSKQQPPEVVQKWRNKIKAEVDLQREVLGTHFRFIVSGHLPTPLQDDAKCNDLFEQLGIPITRIGMTQPFAVEKMLGIPAETIDTYYRSFLASLGAAKRGSPQMGAIPDQPTSRQ